MQQLIRRRLGGAGSTRGFAGVLVLLASASIGFATPIIDLTRDTCDTNNCDSIEIGGRLTGNQSESAPWTVEVFNNGDAGAAAAECVRLQVVKQNADLEMVVVGPDGDIYRNDNGLVAGCIKCPLVKLVNPVPGNYSVSINQRTGNPNSSRFVFAYGRYNAGNDNCSPPTDPE